MKKRLFRLFSLVSLTFVGASALVVAVNKGFKTISNVGTGGPFSITLDGSNAPLFDDEDNGWTREGEYQNVVEKDTYALSMKYRLAQTAGSGHVVLAPHGYMYNEVDDSTFNNKISGLTSVLVDYTSASSISIRTSLTDDGKEFGAPQTLTSGVALSLADNPYYFIIEAGDSEATINSATFYYTCVEHSGVVLGTLSGEYTGIGNDDGYTYKLTLNGSSATIASVDKPTPASVNGTAAIVNGNKIQCTLEIGGTYTSQVSDDHSKLTFVSKDGNASAFPTIDFYKVYKVEDFEGYSATGEGFGGKPNNTQRGAESLYDMSGLRAHWHSDWYTTGKPVSYFGDNGWQLMAGTDFLTYSGSRGHNGSKAAAFKGNTNGLRHIQMKGALGLPNIIGRGSYLSFWAKPSTQADLSTNKTADTNIKVNVYYAQQVTKGNVGTAKTAVDVNILGNCGWQRYIIPLDATKDYYSFGFYDNKSSQVYLGVDDVEIFTVDPSPVHVTGISLNESELALEVGQSSTLVATLTPSDTTFKNVAWSSDNTSVATVSGGTVTAIGPGEATITATAEGNHTATCDVVVTSATPQAAYPTGSYKGTATVLGADYSIVIALGNRSNGMVAVRLANKDAIATGITYDDSTQQFTITTTGDYSGYSYGNITGTYDDANDQLTNISCSGSISSGVSNNGNITATKMDVWDCDGTTSQLQSTFKRRYMSGSWQVDTGNADRITSNTEQFVSGTGSVKRRGYSGGAVALNFYNDFSPAKTVANVQFWVYNPSGSDITLRMWGYKAVNFGSNFETGTVVATAGQWTYVAMGFTSASIYNFQIADFNNTGVYLSFDNIALF